MVQRVGAVRRVVVHTLRVVAGRDMLRFVTLDDDDVVIIGRDETCSLALSDASVSRRHARVRLMNGQVVVEDLGSTNGTAVNSQFIARATLNVGDHLEIGAVSLRLDILSLEEISHLENVLARLEAPRRDALTGLLTRAFIEDDLPDLMLRCGRAQVDLTCLFLDIDFFKQVNDRFGHQVGDDALLTVSRLMLVSVRDTDPCVRYGGEELLMFLQGTNEAASYEVAERIRKTIAGHDWARTSTGLRVTASIGVAQWSVGEPSKDWLARADKALYASKANGRNRVTRSSEVER
jgi:diguanylate cyclase (GGDEF)-like protein